ncbi:MAG TPA: hypothetical protein VGS22_03440 [Thermoanaerobaculia bacterium]|jgi:pimeloyl-ACP methyl ester carboxylesterase|nr:hypothetical protein [Thermoanaerobaculia bacterium]
MTEVVVFIPGVMGSVLRLGNEVIWPGSAWSLVGAYQKMTELLRTDLVATDVIRDFAIAEQYTSLLDDLRTFGFKEGERLVLFPYDWRKSNAVAAEGLAQRLDDLVAADSDVEITLLAHSMGGLVSRYFLESGQFNTRPGYAAIRRLIALATPHRGAPLALAAAVGKQKRLFLSAEQVHLLASHPEFPSVYQLLPPLGEPFAWDGGFSQKLATLDVYDSITASALGLVEENLQSARQFHAGLDPAKRPEFVRYFLFYGTRQTTISASSVRLKAADPKSRVENLEIEDGGDGTVPVWSGMLPGVQGRAVGGEHGSIYKNADLRRTLGVLLGYTGILAAAAATTSVEVAVRDRVVEPEDLMHVSLALSSGVPKLEGSLRLERAILSTTGTLDKFVSAGNPYSIRYEGADAERLAVTLDAPELPGLYRLSFTNPSGTMVLGFDDFFVQEPA